MGRPRNKFWFGTEESSPPDSEEKEYIIVSDEHKDTGLVRSEKNRLYFYSKVNRNSILELNQKIQNIDRTITADSVHLEHFNPPSIYLHINSNGGSLLDGLAAVDYIKNCNNTVVTIIDGACASAATFLSVIGDHRIINACSFILIHQLSSLMWGTYEEIKDDKENCDLFMNTIKSIYRKHTKIPAKKLNEILKRDLWFDSETALKYGLVDEIR